MKLLAICVLVLCLSAALPAEASVRRFVIVVGNNAGAPERPALRYAETDASKLARVLREVGDVAERDLFVLQGKGASDLELVMGRAKARIAEAKRVPGTRTLLVFYFSGHGDGEALELGGERVSFAHLKALLAGTGAQTRVAIVDACQSGNAILKKGGVPVEAFTVQIANQLGVSGDVFITSTAANENALESSELQGSFFTSHIVSGLRGAADASGDLNITLQELYRYAYDRTVATTALTSAGTQHPTYKLDIAGQGEIVLSDLRRASSNLELPKDADRVLITDASKRQVIAEVLPGAARSIALAPGRYEVRSIRGGRSHVATVLLTDGARQHLNWEQLQPSPVAVASKGTSPRAATVAALSPARPVGPKDESLRICVLGFKNLTGDPTLDYLGDAFAEAVTTDFSVQPGVRLIERGQLELDLQELEFSAGKYVDPQTRATLGRIKGAEVVVVGSYQRAGKVMRVNGRFVHVETGEVLFALKVERPDKQLLPLQDAVAGAVNAWVPELKARLRGR